MAVGFAQWGNDLYTGKRSYDIVGHRRWWFTVSGVLVLAAIVLLFAPGLNPGIEFRGGSEFVVTGAANRDQQKAVDVVAAIDSQEVALVTNMGSDSLRVQTRQLANAEVDVLAHTGFPRGHWRKIASTNPLERINKEIKRRSNVVGIFPDDASVIRLVGAVLLDQHDDWAIAERRYLSEESMAAIDTDTEEITTTDTRELPAA